jgi:hypothetical protein
MIMKKTLLIYLLLIFPALFLLSCSEESSELEALENLNIHQPGVMDSTSANFHGKFFVQKNMKFTDCQKCHGKNLDGGITMAKSCNECHSLATIHINLNGVQDTTSANFHGRYLLQHSLADCGQCHGKSFAGGSSSPSCATCHEAISVHKTALLDTASADFHGKYLLTNKFSQCQSCHGQNFTGGISSPSCATCHKSIDVHKEGIVDTASVNFHGKYLFKDGLKDCSSCHGTDFKGGIQSPACTTCHTTLSAHKEGIVDPNSPNFHGKYELTNGFAPCQKCHGDNFQGSVTSPSCSNCHKSIDVHKTGIVDVNSANFHGKYALKSGLADCSSCHGPDFSGGSQSPKCTDCHSSIAVHKTGYKDSNSPDFHGKNQLAKDFTACKTCHGDNFQGGLNSPSCSTCHASIDVHKSGITDQNSANFHGKYKLKSGLSDCSSCHGSSFTGGMQSPSCTTCHSTIDVHKSGIIDQNSPNFHGKYPLTNGFTPCKTCHGDNFQGGNNSVACSTCHSSITVHKTGITDPNSSNFHGKFLKANAWNISACASCHNSSFTGGTQSPTCKTSGCHTSAQGPAACNTCHGDFNNPSQVSPPKDLDGNTSTSSPGVGAHAKHLSAFANGISLACSECHTVPADVNAAGHLGSDGNAELSFGAFTNKLGGTSYDFGTNKCANTYCHGNFEFKKADASSVSQNQYTADKMVGNKRAPKWNVLDGSEVKCSSCHGKSDADPSPIGHIPYTIDQCVWCHSTVVDASGTIIDKSRHINGKANVFGTKIRK